MNAHLLAAAVACFALPAFAEYRFDESRGTCVDAQGREGFNGHEVGPCADLRGADLEAANLEGADLRGARLEGADLQDAKLTRADLRGARMDGADLSRAVLTGARLEAASLQEVRLVASHLEHAHLEGARLGGADLRNACLFRTGFERADLRTAHFSRTRALLEGARWVGAVVSADTLPFGEQELADRAIVLDCYVLSLVR